MSTSVRSDATRAGEGGPRRARPAGRLESRLGFRLGRAHRSLREAWEGQIADLGLSAPQAAVLRAVCERPGSGLREVARRMQTDPMNVKRLADHLEDAGLLHSETHASRRRRRDLFPTRAGATIARSIDRRAASWDRCLSRLFGAGELEELERLLSRLDDALRDAPRGLRAAKVEAGA